jgi:hypothetical protein
MVFRVTPALLAHSLTLSKHSACRVHQDTVRLDLGLLVKKKAQYNIRDNATSRLFLLVFLLYPSLTNTILEGFACRKIGENESVLHVDYAMRVMIRLSRGPCSSSTSC